MALQIVVYRRGSVEVIRPNSRGLFTPNVKKTKQMVQSAFKTLPQKVGVLDHCKHIMAMMTPNAKPVVKMPLPETNSGLTSNKKKAQQAVQSAFKTLHLKVGVLDHWSRETYEHTMAFLTAKTKIGVRIATPQVQNHFGLKWKESLKLMEQIRGVRKEINFIHSSINIFQKPDSSFVLKMKRRAELLDVEEELMKKEDQLVRECKRLFNGHNTAKDQSHKLRYSLIGIGICLTGSLYKAYCDNKHSKKMDEILHQIETSYTAKGSGGYGIGSAVSSVGNYLYGCGAWTVNKMKFW